MPCPSGEDSPTHRQKSGLKRMGLAIELEQILRASGADIVGFADLRGLSPDVRENLPFGISIAVSLNATVVANIKEGPTEAYDKEYQRANVLLDSLGERTAQFLREHGHGAKFWPSSNHSRYSSATLSMLLPHKTVATRAGMGWIGKNALLINTDFGSAIRITSVLTDAVLPAGVPTDSSQCGKCSECVTACPVHAVAGENWTAGMERACLVDASTCRTNAENMTIARIGYPKTICGICIPVCPWTQRYLIRQS